jgi:hypothetical protein
MFSLIADLIVDGDERIAGRMRRALISADNGVVPGQGEPAYPELFKTLLTQGRADQTCHMVSAAP